MNNTIIAQPQDILQKHFGFSSFRGEQEAIINAILCQNDVIAIMPTGFGKSLCYQVPALCLPGLTIVVSPLIALMKDQVDFLQQKNIDAGFINSTLNTHQYTQRLNNIQTGKIKILYIAPERFYSDHFFHILQNTQISLVAIDEAHCISEWGHDFRPSFLRLSHYIDKLCSAKNTRPPILAVSATATPQVRNDIIKNLKLNNPQKFISGFRRHNLRLYAHIIPREDKAYYVRKLLNQKDGSAIVYAGTRKTVEQITAYLQQNNISANSYHAGLSKEQRELVQNNFMQNKFRCIVATNAFGMGIDKSNIRVVIHVDLPSSIEAYYQEMGRAGRDGQESYCMLLYDKGDLRLRYFFLDAENPEYQIIKEVYHFLQKQDYDPTMRIIHVSNKEILENLSEPTNEMTISTVLKILEKEGYIKRKAPTEQMAEITFHKEPNDILQTISNRAKSQKTIINAFQELFTININSAMNFSLPDFCEITNQNKASVQRALKALASAEYITYTPPQNGRLIELVRDEEFNMDTNILKQKKQLDYEKLDLLVQYVHNSKCRHKYILDYFEDDDGIEYCGMCDNCGQP